MEEQTQKVLQQRIRSDLPDGRHREPLLTLRLLTLVILVVLLTLHIRSLRVFRWEQSVSGGALVTYCISAIGLAMCAGTNHPGGEVLQAYLCGTGAAVFSINAISIWHRWKRSGPLTRVLADLLLAMGIRLRRQVMIKVVLSSAVALLLFIDAGFAPLFAPYIKST